MEYSVTFSKRALQEIALAHDWYEEQRLGLGQDFLNSLETSFNKIKQLPFSYLEITPKIRRTVIDKFPYSIFYTITSSEVHILAIFHNSQNPSKRPFI